jgi:hypothetical protein
MGDRGALTGFLLPCPMLQLEGIVGDASMLAHIENQDCLNAVLADYGVDYLLVSERGGLHCANGCYAIAEPHIDQAGMHSCVMRAVMPSSPSCDIYTPDDEYHTYIFPVSERAIASRQAHCDTTCREIIIR